MDKSKLQLPLARTRKFVKDHTEVKTISADAIILLTKAAEIIVEHLAREGGEKMKAAKRKTLQYKFIDAVIAESPALDFLADIVP